MNNRILIYGATGRTGKLAVEYALSKGYSVTALVRNPDKMQLEHERLTIIKGSPVNINDVRLAMKDCTSVVCVLSGLSAKEAFSFKKITAPHILKRSIENSIQCMREYGIKRIISLSSIGVGDSHRYAPGFMRLIIRLTNFKLVFADHDDQEQLLMHSGLDWTIARPVALNNNEQSGELVISYDKKPSPFRMSRKQLAKFIIDNIDAAAFIHKAPLLSERG